MGLPVPQYVVAWAWPSDLMGYLQKAFLYPQKNYIKRVNELWYWYRADHKAYKNANAILTVTNSIEKELRTKYPHTYALPPCIALPAQFIPKGGMEKIKIMTGALDLSDPRKNILWMVDCLGKLKSEGADFNITLVGDCSEATFAYIKSRLPQALLPGRIPRNKFQDLMQEHDIFIFSSLQDDWGYVVTEALSKGLAIVVPNEHPFTQMVPDESTLYPVQYEKEFLAIIKSLLFPKMLSEIKRKQFVYAKETFSYHAFYNKLIKIFNAKS
jgi:glycosyltransferase involved in cell wall biosynthesis